jgi:hypothetical protein
LSNLRWDTRGENTRDQVRHGTHQESRRVVCPLDHLLVAPNLVPALLRRGKRACLACHRARDRARRRLGRQPESDEYAAESYAVFDQLMSASWVERTTPEVAA